MTSLSERLAFRISDAELNRRWDLTRKEMDRQGVDVLVLQNSNEFNGGYVRWFTDVAARHGNPMTVIFPRHGRMTVITSGPRNGKQTPPDDGSGLYRGVEAVLTSPYGTSECTTDDVDGELASQAISAYPHGTIGFVGQGAMRWSFGDHVRRAFHGTTFVNASDFIDLLKAVKSPEEYALIKQCAELQDTVWNTVLSTIRPGMREVELAASAFRQAQLLGSTDGLILTGSAPMGKPSVKGHRHFQNRILQPDDQFTMLVEVNGPGGYYTELGRTCVLGKAPQELKDEFQIAIDAQQATVNLLKPGARPTDIWDAHNAFMKSRGRPEERRLFCHGQGYDLVERPSLRDNDPMALRPDMNIVVHPTYATDTVYSWICDNYFVTDSGVERLHKTPQHLFEVI